ncbi:MAG: ferredoxin [Patescibacteria group bacterium]
MQIKIDQTKCIGCGTCSALCSDYFDLDNNGKAVVKQTEVGEASCVKEAAECCPAQCIAIK